MVNNHYLFRQWSVFVRKHMPKPGRYKATVECIHATKAVIWLEVGKQRIPFEAQLMYGRDQYADLPRLEADDAD